MIKRNQGLRLFVLVLLVLIATGERKSAFSQNTGDSRSTRSSEMPSRQPVLDGHRFVNFSSLRHPFVATEFAIVSGGGVVTDLEFVLEDVGGEDIGRVKGDLAFLATELYFQKALSQTFAFYLNTDVLARIATNEESILSQGLTGVFGYSFGLRARVIQSSKIYLSSTASLSRNSLVGITPLLFLQKVVASGFEPGEDNGLIREEKSNRVTIGLDGAYSFSPLIGMLAHAEYGSSNPFGEEKNTKTVTSFGGTLSVDFGAVSKFPVGTSMGLITNSLNPNANDFAARTNMLLFGLFYTGRQDMDLGLEVSTARLKQNENNDRFSSMLIQFHLGYLF